MQMHTHTHTHPSCCCRCFFSSLHDFCLPLACWEALFCRTFLENRLGEASLENVFPKRCKSLIREPSLPCRSAARAWRSASAARSLHDVLWAFSAATLVSFLRWLYSVLRRVMSCGGAFFKLRQASFFFLDRLRTALVIQSGSLFLSAGERDLQPFEWMI